MSIETYGKYQLLKKLATGGMAQIYLARQQGLEGFEKLLVVKRILPHLAENEDFIKMFLDEARIAARLNHPNIVQIFDLGSQDDSFFIAMEYIHGEDVRRAWKRADAAGKPFPIPLVCRIIMDACAGLDYAHKKTDQQGKPLNIVHRDISPQNILVTFEGGVKVVDFGIAKAADQATVTRSGVLKGKYSYMSPEQASGKRIDNRTDIFALGVVLYEVLTGTRLFKRSNDIQTLNAVTECKVAPPSQVNARLPASLDPIILKALSKKADDRYVDAAAFQGALEDWLLQNQMPSSSVHLAAFMSEIYADRLQREAEEGRLVVEELDQSRNKDEEASPNASSQKNKATPSFSSLKKPTTSMKVSSPTAPVTDEPAEATRSQRPSRQTGAGPPPLKRSTVSKLEKPSALEPDELSQRVSTEVSSTESSSKTRRLPLILGVGAVVLAAVGVGAWALFPRPVVEAKLQLSSEPNGASLVLDGRRVPGVTLLTLNTRVGRHEVVLTKPGFQTQEGQLDVGKEGSVTTLTLIPLSAVAPEKDAGAKAAVERVTFVVRSNPSAQLSVNGESRGQTPVSLEVEPGTALSLTLRAQGHRELEEKLVVDAAGEQTFTLEKKTAPVQQNPNPNSNPNVVVTPVQKQFGSVRFVVKPYADVVECDGVNLGETPLPDQKLLTGAHRCVFKNKELNKVETRQVTVSANDTTKVFVNF